MACRVCEELPHQKPQDVLRLIKDHIKSNAHGQEQARLDEEAIKAELRINGTNGVSPKSWEDSILKAEDNFYLRGQIIASLSWSRNGRHYDKALFDEYVDYLLRYSRERHTMERMKTCC